MHTVYSAFILTEYMYMYIDYMCICDPVHFPITDNNNIMQALFIDRGPFRQVNERANSDSLNTFDVHCSPIAVRLVTWPLRD
jgi:hypothetical protein